MRKRDSIGEELFFLLLSVMLRSGDLDPTGPCFLWGLHPHHHWCWEEDAPEKTTTELRRICLLISLNPPRMSRWFGILRRTHMRDTFSIWTGVEFSTTCWNYMCFYRHQVLNYSVGMYGSHGKFKKKVLKWSNVVS